MPNFTNAQEFLKIKDSYELGFLTTEHPHPLTENLSGLCQASLGDALNLLKKVDLLAMNRASDHLQPFNKVVQSVNDTIKGGGKIFLLGCGATGRLALNLEFLWRQKNGNEDSTIQAMIAGGDVALVSSLEGHEDHPEFGARHLEQMNFSAEDLLIAVTEGGETPYVIGAAQHASKISNHPVFFVFTNPIDEIQKICRSREIIHNSNVEPISVPVGPMALAGSTRMQSSTVLMMLLGYSIGLTQWNSLREFWNNWIKSLEQLDYSLLEPFTRWESQLYKNDQRVLYRVDDLALPIFTDTTERAPTFSMVPMSPWQGMLTPESSLVNVSVQGADSAESAWKKLLKRDPQPLNWQDIKTQKDYLLANDFSENRADQWRDQWSAHEIQASVQDKNLILNLDQEITIPLHWGCQLELHGLVKVLMNAHSTAVMGALARFKSNIMTWVKPSNGKLIDRATRYVVYLLHQNGYEEFTYDQIVRELFKVADDLQKNESIVLKTYENLVNQKI